MRPGLRSEVLHSSTAINVSDGGAAVRKEELVGASRHIYVEESGDAEIHVDLAKVRPDPRPDLGRESDEH